MSGNNKAEGRVLLPTNVTPSKYTIEFDCDLEQHRFEGKERIDVDVSVATKTIVMHSKDIYVKSASYVASNGRKSGAAMEAEAINFNVKLKTLELVFPSEIVVGKGVIELEFTGEHNNQMAGFYRSGYSDIDGTRKTMVSTQFEALDARRCFPCWDEPAVKASFSISLVIDSHLTALSNMPETSLARLEGGKTRVTFADTPVMSTYLLAMCVGEFDFVQATTEHGVQVRVYTPPGRSADGRFALDVATKTLDLYDDFFQTAYPLPKLDMIAIPEFAMGAMENWGLVTYREVDLLINDQKASSSQKQRVASVVAHELAHQWFGNLVTMRWWDDLWLNEGFASWTQNWALDAIFPDWNMWEQFATDDAVRALRLDSLRSSHPIQCTWKNNMDGNSPGVFVSHLPLRAQWSWRDCLVRLYGLFVGESAENDPDKTISIRRKFSSAFWVVPIAHAEEVEEVFDGISYSKGACVVRMLYALLGPKDFQEGLKVYMARHAYGNTETFDLWAAWEEVSGKPIGQVMASWTEQMGFPLLEVTGADGGTVQLKQSWFLADGQTQPGDEEKSWVVPVRVAVEKPDGSVDASGLTLMKDKAAAVPSVPGGKAGGFILVNSGHATLARVRYQDEMYAKLADGLASKSIDVIDRAVLVSDAFELGRVGKLSLEPVVSLVKACVAEDNYTVWSSIDQVVHGLSKVSAARPEIKKEFDAFVVRLATPAFLRLGWDEKPDDGHLDRMLRALLISMLAAHTSEDENDSAFLREARSRFDATVPGGNGTSSSTPLPNEFKTPVFRLVLRTGGEAEYERLLAYLETLVDVAEKKHVMLSLGYASTAALKLRTLDWAVKSGEVKLQDFFYPIGGVSTSGPEGANIAFDYYKNNFDHIKAMLAKASPSLMDAAIVYSTVFHTKERADDVEAFFKANPLPQSARKIAQTVENMRVTGGFVERALASTLGEAKFWGRD